MRKKFADSWINKCIKAVQSEMKRTHIGAYASSAAFFTFLSLIPILLVFFSILPYTPVTKATLLEVIELVIPSSFLSFAVGIVEEMYNKTSGAYLSVSIIITLWSAGKGTLAMIQALNTLHGVENQRAYPILRLKASLYTLIMLLSISVLMVMVVFGGPLVSWLTGYLPHLFYMFNTILHVRIALLLAFLTIFLCMVYVWLPETRLANGEKRKRSVRREFPGAFFAALAWYFSSWLFSEYVRRFPAFSTYGSLATVIIVMFWLYLCFYIILLGAMMNKNAEAVNEALTELFKGMLKPVKRIFSRKK